ncbi:alpha/beta fold hydrolase [Streptomyces sp. NRRL S-474]|uniref:alpha/beta fold hydrolase n=1 Tax=Streptomyces sp. NRRL S-474 TaxID=1463909 RepID=UPI0004C8C3A8|nr:alpha/beta fold hydrolase [Streptomyces sp. NRRL S-474]
MNARGTYDMDGFLAAYDKVMAKWPASREAATVPTPFGATHVNMCGPADGPPLLLLPGGGSATSASWYRQAAELSHAHRLYAVDLIGAPGRSTPAAGRRPRTIADLVTWLDALLKGLGLAEADLGGHSYGAWIALHYALRAPHRVRRLVLLDPTQCFAGFKPAYVLHALPMLLRPTPRRVRTFLEWETGGASLDPDWLALQETAAGFPAPRPVTGPRPQPIALRRLQPPVLVLLAGDSRTHDPAKVAAGAAALLPQVTTTTLPHVSHHALPHAAPPEASRGITDFLSGPVG